MPVTPGGWCTPPARRIDVFPRRFWPPRWRTHPRPRRRCAAPGPGWPANQRRWPASCCATSPRAAAARGGASRSGAPQPRPTPPAAVASAVTKQTNVPVQMSDGAVLYLDVVRPADSSGNPLPGHYPVLLTQTPYNKNAALNFENDYLVEHGYIQVIADARGTG